MNAFFELNEQTIPIVEQIGSHMPGGFFIYKASRIGELIYANHAVFDIFGCEDLEEFKELTGFTFRGMLHPNDYEAVYQTLNKQVSGSENVDHVEYRIIRRDGAVRWVDDYGHFTQTETYGGIHYVFISDITEKRERMESDLAVRRADINEQATEQMLLLTKQMSEREGVTEALKAQDQMLWVQRMNNIRDRAMEIVNHDLIYV